MEWGMSNLDAAQAIYDRLWSEARESFIAGKATFDPHLRDRATDARRGITLLIRPSADVIARIMALLAEIDAIIPGQHGYDPASLHITVLPLISAAPDVRLAAIPEDAYRAVFEAVIPAIEPFDVRFTDVTASRESVFVYGWSEGDALNDLRESLRGPLHVAALAERLELRYQSVTTHATILRFQTLPEPDQLRELAAFLDAHRERDLRTDLGAFTVREVEFVYNDWYMSRDVVRVLGRYALGGS
jgi:2'-5' RNA ligase